ncbi:MAG: hypothetical protein U9N77_11835 [Thermodesulfobacteriota bacterium]|nr:hypothetical protein [Thermodesulfobacteriota bacterium]
MSKKKKQKKKNKKRLKKAHSFQVDGKKNVQLQLVEYSITYEPLSQNVIPVEIEDQVEELFHTCRKKPEQVIPQLKKLIEQFPKVYQLYNYLYTAYTLSGNINKAEAICLMNYKINPEYLFAKLNYAEVCMRNGEFEKVPEIFKNKFDLKVLYPERDLFHITEVTSFYSIIALYCVHSDMTAQASNYLKILKEIDPGNKSIRIIKHQLMLKKLNIS